MKKVFPHYFGHRKRLREKFKVAGSKGLRDYELVELLLTYAIPRKDVKPVAKSLLKKFGSFGNIFDARIDELQKVEGIGPGSAVLIKLVKEILSLYLEEKMKRKDALTSPSSVVDFARVKLSGFFNEVFMVIYLNAKNEVIDYEIIQEGTVDGAIIYPRRVIESAILHHAAGIILVHNHPSGHPEASVDDKELTRTLRDVAKFMDVRVVDHIIVGKNGYFSFAERGLL